MAVTRHGSSISRLQKEKKKHSTCAHITMPTVDADISLWQQLSASTCVCQLAYSMGRKEEAQVKLKRSAGLSQNIEQRLLNQGNKVTLM